MEMAWFWKTLEMGPLAAALAWTETRKTVKLGRARLAQTRTTMGTMYLRPTKVPRYIVESNLVGGSQGSAGIRRDL